MVYNNIIMFRVDIIILGRNDRIGDAHFAETLTCVGGPFNIYLYVIYHIIYQCTYIILLYNYSRGAQGV